MHEEIPMTTMQPPRSIAVCILGMHRSGTSTISRAVNLLGAYLGEDKDIMSPQEDNPEGFWERNDIAAIHDRLLTAFHLRWDTPMPLIEGWHRSSFAEPFCNQLREIVRTAFADCPLWAWKDPRTCILIDFWKELVAEVDAELVVLFAVRNPLDVAASLRKRNGFSVGKSFGIWFAYNLIALRALRGIRTAFISYDRLLERGEEELRRCAAVLNIAWPDDNAELKRSLDSFLRQDLRHSKSHDADLEGAPLPVRRLFRIITAALERPDPVTDSFFEEIDDLHQEFLGFAELFRADIEAMFDDDQTIASLQREMSERDKQQMVSRDHQLQEIHRILDAKATAESLAITRLADMDKLAERLRYTDEVKIVSEELAHVRLAEIECLQAHLTATQDAKTTAESLAITRLADMDKLTERLRYTDEVKTASEELAHVRLAEIELLQAHLTATQDAKATAESLAITRLADMDKLAERLRYTDEVKTASEELAHVRLAEIERLQALLTATQDAKATAESLAITRLADLGKLAERLRYTDEVKTASEELAHVRLAEIERLQALLTATQDAKTTAESLAITRLADMDKLAERLRYTDEVKTASEELAHTRLAEIELLQAHLTATQDAKTTAESLAITRLADMDKLTERLRYTDEVKTASEELAHVRLAEIERLQALLTATQDAKATAESLAITRLAELDKLRLYLADVKEDLDNISDENKKISIEIDAIRTSWMWKLLSALKSVAKNGKDA